MNKKKKEKCEIKSSGDGESVRILFAFFCSIINRLRNYQEEILSSDQ
jgi:hypothetical protein